mmetsp:Transcript_8944/g.19965  ORF Transcript_8944/g.19965 Transcript_8944/m.19965 type:complete len:217 (-) Transcript_8944:112-762(-)
MILEDILVEENEQPLVVAMVPRGDQGGDCGLDISRMQQERAHFSLAKWPLDCPKGWEEPRNRHHHVHGVAEHPHLLVRPLGSILPLGVRFEHARCGLVRRVGLVVEARAAKVCGAQPIDPRHNVVLILKSERTPVRSDLVAHVGDPCGATLRWGENDYIRRGEFDLRCAAAIKPGYPQREHPANHFLHPHTCSDCDDKVPTRDHPATLIPARSLPP